MNETIPEITSVRIRELGLREYLPTYHEMCAFSQSRAADSVDEFWILEHNPVYTLGLNGKKDHIIDVGDIPIVDVDRGGQVTYHGPGQLVVYLLIDVRRRSMGVRAIVSAMEESLIQVLGTMSIKAYAKKEAPGVYVDEAKIAALGLRIKNGKSYHGLSLNIDMDLAPFRGINPCGYENLQVTQVKDLYSNFSKEEIKNTLIQCLLKNLNYSHSEQ